MTLVGLLSGLLATAAMAQGEQKPEPKKEEKLDPKLERYLTKEGNLRGALEVRDEKGGFGTFFGTTYFVTADGQFTVTRIVRRQPTVIAEGRLSKRNIQRLAEVLLRNDTLSLPSAGRPKVNPHSITVTFAGTQSVLTIGVDQRVAPADPTDDNPAVPSRYGSILSTVRSLTQEQ
jgi:hypothetical protein